MTAEEVALRRFRAAVEFARRHRKESASAARLGNAVEQYAHWRLSSAARDTASDIARIIRAIRAERGMESARLAEAYGKGRVDALLRSRAEAYAQGRRDALRGVQGACLFEMGRLEEKPRKYGSWDWEGYPEDQVYDALSEVVEAAEEAARAMERNR